MSPWLYYLLAGALVLACGACWLSNLISLPGNWGVVALTAAFAFLLPSSESRGIVPATVAIVAGLAVLGEVLEFVAGAAGAAKSGASRRSVVLSLVGAMIGGIAGALAGAPIPVIGSLVAAVVGGSLGAFAGAYLGESWQRRPLGERWAAGKGAAVGRFWGTIGKFAVGGIMVGITAVDALFA